MIKLTEKAKEEILKTLNSPQIPSEYALRVGMKGGSCAGTYMLGLDKPTEHDELHLIDGVRVLIDKRQLMYVVGVEVDYVNNSETVGFTIKK